MGQDILGVILAGGQARRMGGGDKGRLDLGGASLLELVVARLGPQVGALALSANGEAARFDDLGLPVLADSLAGYLGPLAGVLAGMDYAATRGISQIVTAAADTPFLPLDLVVRLQAAQTESQPIVLAATREGERVIRQPTFGLWPVHLREDLRAALSEGLSKVVIWAERHGYALALFEGGDPFFNVNTPDELEAARRLWLSEQQR